MTNIPADQRLNIAEGTDFSGIVSRNNARPAGFALLEAFPNPFNNEVNLSFEVKTAGNIKLDIINLEGKVVANLLDAFCPSGNFNKKFAGSNFSNGVYFVRLQTLDGVHMRKIMLIK
jgi:hypothetical protein